VRPLFHAELATFAEKKSHAELAEFAEKKSHKAPMLAEKKLQGT